METINLMTTSNKEELKDFFKNKVNNTKIVELSLIEYINKSLEDKTDRLCNGWEYLKNNLIEELKTELLSINYWSLVYNSEKVDYILNQLFTTDEINELDKEVVKQLDSWVYVWNKIKREEDIKQFNQELKIKLTNEGFILQEIFKEENKEVIYLEEELKKLNNKKVICIMDISRIGLMGSFDSKEKIEGKFIYSDYQKALMLLPKRSRTKGHIIRGKFYYKEIK